MAEPARNLDNRIRIQGDTDLGTPEISVGAAITDKIGMHGSLPSAQRAGADQAAPAAYVTGAFGLNSDANMEALYDLVVEMRAALVEKGIIKGAA